MVSAGDGERIAQLGYVAQYKIAARLIYQALKNGNLEWIKMADPEAGQLDDIQIATDEQVDAYQVKWAEFAAPISYSDFVRQNPAKSGEPKHSLFEQLVDGWQRLCEKHPDKNVSVHLIHKNSPSTSTRAQIPLDDNKPRHPHFHGFLKDCWYDKSWLEQGQQGREHTPKGWAAVLTDLQQRAKLNDSDFARFFCHCHLQLHYRLDEDKPANTMLDDDSEDIKQLAGVLTEMVGGEKRIIQLTKNQLLEKLGWTDRFKHQFSHEFPVVDTYQPILATLEPLDEKLTQYEQGYLALIGAPGSGKSTTLTHHLKYKAGFRLVKYYAYVPDSPYQARGEATSFLHDITTSLRRFGFGASKRKQANNRDEYLSLLRYQLVDAHNDWQANRIVTLIMVDGLDHIQRELNPQRSLLADLPLPASLPKGVIFILGTQTLDLDNIPSAIRQHIKPPKGANRIIDMAAMQRKAVFAVIDSFPCAGDLSSADKATIFHKSAGHPLFLNYLLQQLSASSDGCYTELLHTVPAYCGDIEKNYANYWQQIEDSDELVELLGLLARIRTPIDTKEIQRWVSRAVIKQLIGKTSHYFKVENDSTWHFFHNSFRQFIIAKTRIDVFGDQDDASDIDYHNKLAASCAKAQEGSIWRWEQIYHYFLAKNYQAVLEVGQQAYFRQQYFALRHFNSIVDDITLTLQAAKQLEEPLAVVRCLLFETELRERQQAHGQVDMLELIYLAHGVEAAMAYAVDGSRLRIDESKALSFAKVLFDDGHSLAAKRLFALAEPLDILSGAKAATARTSLASLKGWVCMAHQLMALTEIINVIGQISVEPELRGLSTAKELTVIRQRRLLEALSVAVIEAGDAAKINRLYQQLKNHNCREVFILLCRRICHNRIQETPIEAALTFLLKCNDEAAFALKNKLWLAECVYRIKGDETATHQLLHGIDQPQLVTQSRQNATDLAPYVSSIRLNRLLTALGCGVTARVAIANAANAEYQGAVLFERLIVNLANAQGAIWKNKNTAPFAVVAVIKPAFDFLTQTYDQTQNWINWHDLVRCAGAFYAYAIGVCQSLSEECFQLLAKEIHQHWSQRHWQLGLKLEVARLLFEAGDAKENYIAALKRVEDEIAGFDDAGMKIDSYSQLLGAYSLVKDSHKPQQLLTEIIEGSFEIYNRKDDQFSHWVDWLIQFSMSYPDLANEPIKQFCGALVSLENSGRGSSAQDAASKLVKRVTCIDVAGGIDLIKWLFDRGGIDYDAALGGLLEGMLQRADAPIKEIAQTATALLVPFEEYNPCELPLTLVQSIGDKLDRGDAEQLIGALSDAVHISALPTNRHSWLSKMAEGARKYSFEAFVDSVPLKTATAEPPAAKAQTLVLQSGLELNEAQAKSRLEKQVDNVAGLLSLLRQVKTCEYFRWDTLVTPYLAQMDRGQLQAVKTALSPFDISLPLDLSIASYLIQAGEIDGAEALLGERLAATESSSWDPSWAGRSRSSIFQLYKQINSQKYSAKALADLVDNFIGENRYPDGLIRDLAEITSVIFHQFDLSGIWGEITEHVYQLSDFNNTPEQDLPNHLSFKTDQNAVDALVEFVFYLFEIPTMETRDKAVKLIKAFIANGSCHNAIAAQIKPKLQTPAQMTPFYLAVLHCAAALDRDFVTQFQGEITTLCLCKDIDIRLTARDLAAKLNFTLQPVQQQLRQQATAALPLIYQLELPPLFNTKRVLPLAAPGAALSDHADAFERLRPFHKTAEWIAKAAAIPLQNIVASADELMKSLAVANEWDQAAEQRLGKWLLAIELKIAYIRPRVTAAKCALNQIIAELLDAGRIVGQDARMLAATVKRCDLLMLEMTPMQKPACIHKPGFAQHDFSDELQKWLNDWTDASNRLQTTDGKGGFILGETTIWRRLDWELPTEERFSMVCIKNYPFITEGIAHDHHFFPHHPLCYADEYPAILGIDEPSLIIMGQPWGLDLGRGKWLAVNPVVAAALGWHLAAQGIFRWLDANNALMVESICWMDGPLARQPPKREDICGEGWLVVATPQAVEQIKAAGIFTTKIDVTVRSYGEDSLQPTDSRFYEVRQHW